jgi:hypothetical protein
MSERNNFRPESFVPLLERIRDILLKHDFISQGTHAAELIDLAHLGSEEFVTLLQIGGVWGSAGSIADSVDLRKSFDPVDAETERDSLELTRALIQLADQMREQGIGSEGSEFIAKLFRRGLQQRGSQKTTGHSVGPEAASPKGGIRSPARSQWSTPGQRADRTKR